MPNDPFLTPRSIDRRTFVTVGVGVFAALSLPLALRRHVTIVRRTLPLMGTIAEIQVAHRDPMTAEAAIDAAYAELGRVEALMTRFRATSDVGRANLCAARDGVPVSLETAELVEEALAWSTATEGRFDPAIGAACQLWNVENRHEPPDAAQVHALAARGFWRKVDVARRAGAGTLRFEDRDLRLDLGAIAKGYGIDRAAATLRDRGITSAIVTVGGDLYALGGSPDGGPWTVGIRDPHNLRGIAGTLHVRDRAVATSGDYERFFRWRGVRYHHLMDPVTAAPRRAAVRSTTVLADRAMDADAASTSAYGLPRADALALVRRRLPTADVIPLT